MVFDFLYNKKESTALLIDIGNGSIGGAFISTDSGKVPRIIYNVRLPFIVVDKPDTLNLVSGMDILLDGVLNILIKNGFKQEYWKNREKKLTSALITFSSPWFQLKTKQIDILRDESFFITEEFLDDIIKKEEKIFEKELSGGSDNTKSNSFKIIEKSIIHAKINGYTINNVIGKKTKKFDAFICMSLIPENIEDKVQSAILKYVNIQKEKIIMHSFPMVSFSTIRDLFIENSDFIIMDVTGEITDLSLVRDSAIVQTVSFPSGRNFIIRQIAKTFDVQTEIAESMLHIYLSNKANSSVSGSIENILTNIEKEWSIHFERALRELSKEMVLPKKVYITSDSDVAKFYVDFLKLSKTDSTFEFRKNIDITHVNHDTLSHLCQSNARALPDEFIEILAIFYNKILKN